ncbi:MAG: calcium-binding protein [Prochloraceae cyanobacterium]|nr:calcium-binding protein [Prochloraceae cyanobacterium]
MKTIGLNSAEDIFGTLGSDFIDGLDGNDFVFGDAGDDTILGGTGKDTLDGGTGNDVLIGESGNDRLLGWDGDDTLKGGRGNDVLNGENGNDILVGGGFDLRGFDLNSKELDTLTGGAGADVFILGDSLGAYYLDSFGFEASSFATITDFDALEGDKIQVFGTSQDYTLSNRGNGVDILYQGDLIAFVENTTDVVPTIDFVFV